MPLVNLKQILAPARVGAYAVGSFNVVSLEFMNAIVAAAQKEQSPVILSVAEVHFPFLDMEQVAPLLVRQAERSNVPIVLHLDHGGSAGTAMRAIRWGFTSVMVDLSTLPYEHNISETAALTRMAHEVGVSVEAELGVIGGGGESNYVPSSSSPENFTDPEQAVDFVQRTGVDALAVSVGNVHGFYQGEPKLDFKLMERLQQAVPVPLVLHGGSGISDDDFRRAISLGIRKINFFTGMSRSAVEKIEELISRRQPLGFESLMQEVGKTVSDVVAERMRVFGSSGKVWTQSDNKNCCSNAHL